MNQLFFGLGLITLSAVASGLFAVPLRHRRRYSVENMWLPAFLLGYLVIPHIAVILLLPEWTSAIRTAGMRILLPSFLLGLGWGTAGVLFASAVSRVGLSLGYAVIMGLITIFGAGIPLIRHGDAISVSGGFWIGAGMLVATAGVAVCSRAGVIRETGGHSLTAGGFRWAMLLCLGAGLLSACNNLGFDFATVLADAPAMVTAGPLGRMICWLPVYWGGSVMVAGITAVQITRNNGWQRYVEPGTRRDLLLTLLMGVVLSLTQIPYGIGAYYLGPLGTSVGFAVNMVFSLMAANMVGILSGEWKGAPVQAFQLVLGGILLLLLAVVLLAVGNSISTSSAI